MNEVETFARAGERAGAALGSGVRAARKNAERAGKELAKRMPDHTAKVSANARRARDTAQTALAERAHQAQEVLTEHWGPTLETLAQRWGVAQDVLAERLLEARHELATRIEPEPPRRRRRWLWLVLLVVGVVGAVGAAILTRRPREIEPEPFRPSLAREPGSRDSDPDINSGTRASNGIVGAQHPSASTD
ncbi:MAG: hypothetical protein ACRDTC_00485 [Pseudonocardiaceae bacterium]